MSSVLRTPLLRRALQEQRALVLAIGGLLVLNLVVYLGVIRPSAARVSNVTERTQIAEGELAAARLAHTLASNALTGKSQASQKLDVFYREVLPSDLPSARRLFYPQLDVIARQAGLESRSGNTELVTERERILTQLAADLELTGDYRSIRDFVHRLERGKAFVVIDGMELQQSGIDEALLALKVELSTFYKGPAE